VDSWFLRIAYGEVGVDAELWAVLDSRLTPVWSLDHEAIITARNRPTNVLFLAQGKVPAAGRGARRQMGERLTLTQCVRPQHCLLRVKPTDDPDRHRLMLLRALPLS
jgi:hypothetical protein